MTREEHHEPETKSHNKVRAAQDMIIRARRDQGCGDPKQVAEALYMWFIDAPRSVHMDVLEYFIQHNWSNIGRKMGGIYTPQPKMRSPFAAEKRAAKRTERELKWLGLILNLTGAEVRAARSLPEAVVARVGDNQKVGEVFTLAQLQKACA